MHSPKEYYSLLNTSQQGTFPTIHHQFQQLQMFNLFAFECVICICLQLHKFEIMFMFWDYNILIREVTLMYLSSEGENVVQHPNKKQNQFPSAYNIDPCCMHY